MMVENGYGGTDVLFLERGCVDFPDPQPFLTGTDGVGLVALSRELTAEHLLAAYPRGIFPWYRQHGVFFWFATEPRAVLYPQRLHLSRSLRKVLRRGGFRVGVNNDFPAVISACASVARPGQLGSWITSEFRAAYTELHRRGYAHSFECYCSDGAGGEVLAGGLYGVQIGSVFFGESMFARQNDASKTAFACAVPYLADCGVALIDCQQDTAHLARFGSQLLAFDDFAGLLARYVRRPLRRAPGCCAALAVPYE